MTNLVTQIDSCLPQTQCTLCDYPDCKSYALALASKQEANLGLCVPGQDIAAKKISKILNQPAKQHINHAKQREMPAVLAKIIANECIGCMKCITACPVDAIIGNKKKLHAIISEECTGCQLCIPPCPVDCIELLPSKTNATNNLYAKANFSRQRYLVHQSRLSNIKKSNKALHKKAKQGFSEATGSIQARQNLIQQILKRNNHE